MRGVTDDVVDVADYAAPHAPFVAAANGAVWLFGTPVVTPAMRLGLVRELLDQSGLALDPERVVASVAATSDATAELANLISHVIATEEAWQEQCWWKIPVEARHDARKVTLDAVVEAFDDGTARDDILAVHVAALDSLQRHEFTAAAAAGEFDAADDETVGMTGADLCLDGTYMELAFKAGLCPECVIDPESHAEELHATVSELARDLADCLYRFPARFVTGPVD